jgi:predicted Zn-dependent protease
MDQTPAAAMQRFSGNQAVTGIESVNLTLAVPGVAARFATMDGQARGLMVFVSYQNRTYQLLGLGTPTGFAALEPAIRAADASFAPLTDPAALNVEPARVRVVSVPQATSFTQFAARYPAVAADRLAILNEVQTTTSLQAGQRIKIVEGRVR